MNCGFQDFHQSLHAYVRLVKRNPSITDLHLFSLQLSQRGTAFTYLSLGTAMQSKARLIHNNALPYTTHLTINHLRHTMHAIDEQTWLPYTPELP